MHEDDRADRQTDIGKQHELRARVIDAAEEIIVEGKPGDQ